jgi:tRNA pseudouridine38-40 synthase
MSAKLHRKVKLTIAYDGTSYHGWQTQLGGLVTVQETLEKLLRRLLGHPVSLRSAGRTDARVHADGQVASFFTDTRIPTPRLVHAINHRLPLTIRIRHAMEVPDDFDANMSAVSKMYRYSIYNANDLPPRLVNYCYHFYMPCDIDRMQAGAERLVGTHDFASFASAGHVRTTTVRTLYACNVISDGPWIHVDVQGDGFLYHMVRNIVGSLLDVARGRWEPEFMDTILANRSRASAGKMAPAGGLTMKWVRYLDPWNDPPELHTADRSFSL